MKVLTCDEVAEWCADKGVRLLPKERSVMPRLRLVAPVGDAVAIMVPAEALAQIRLSLVLTFADGFDAASEYLLVLSDWDFWSPEYEAIGSSLLSGLRAKSSEYRSAWESPAHVCDRSQLPDLQAILLLVLAFQWDAYLLPNTGAFLVEINHDGWLRGWASSDVGRDAMKTLLGDWPSTSVSRE